MHGMPIFLKDRKDLKWLAQENRTADFIRFFWRAAGRKERHSADFLSFLISTAWNNKGEFQHPGTSRYWRNSNLAKYLVCEWGGDKSILANAVVKHWPELNITAVKSQLDAPTGITHYYNPLRPKLLSFVKKHVGVISLAFNIVSLPSRKPEKKILAAMKLLDGLPKIKGYTGDETSVLNGITPALACLDPNMRFPIVNRETTKLLHSIGASRNAAGAVMLSELIGQNNVSTNLELDVYANNYDFPHKRRTPRKPRGDYSSGRDIGHKSEESGYAYLTKGKIKIRKAHNQLINKFNKAIRWQYGVVKESVFDVLIPEWKRNRSLLIEAKTGTSGAGGRAQLRQAIGQLFDYRATCFPGRENSVDLAILIPNKPAEDVIRLLGSLGIHALWFDSEALVGTIKLIQ